MSSSSPSSLAQTTEPAEIPNDTDATDTLLSDKVEPAQCYLRLGTVIEELTNSNKSGNSKLKTSVGKLVGRIADKKYFMKKNAQI